MGQIFIPKLVKWDVDLYRRCFTHGHGEGCSQEAGKQNPGPHFLMALKYINTHFSCVFSKLGIINVPQNPQKAYSSVASRKDPGILCEVTSLICDFQFSAHFIVSGVTIVPETLYV